MKGLDLSKFSKVGTSDTHTTFKHKDGHWIKVAHGGLTPKMRDDINSIKLAEGGETGVHKPLEEKGGTSEAGAFTRTKNIPGTKELAKNEHKRALADMKAMPAPKLMAEGGAAKQPTAPPPPPPPMTPDEVSKGFKKATGFDEGGSVKASAPIWDRIADWSASHPNGEQGPNHTWDASTQSWSHSPTPQETSYSPSGSSPLPSVEEAMQPQVGAAQAGMDAGQASYTPPTPQEAAALQTPPQPTPADAGVSAPPNNPPNGPQAIAQFMGGDAAKLEMELARGDIKPETYQSLFDRKDTLGKVGTLFGMLVGGAGAGLSHQPNAIMEMMHQQIQNDIDRQNKSAEHAQNFLRIAQNNPLIQSQVKQNNANAAAVHQAMAYTQASQITFDKLLKDYQAMPSSTPQQIAAKQARQQGIQAWYSFSHDKVFNAIQGAAAMTPEVEQQPTGQPQSQQQSSDNYGIQPLLKPGADIQSRQFLPQYQSTYKEAINQFTQAQQIDKALASIGPAFEKMAANRTSEGRTAQQEGKMIGRDYGPLHMLADATPAVRDYNTAFTTLKQDTANALKGIIPVDEVNGIADQFKPIQGDPPEKVREKARLMAAMFKRAAQTSYLKGLTN